MRRISCPPNSKASFVRFRELVNKTVVIWGAGREGLTAYADLARHGVDAEFALTGSGAAPEGLPAPAHTGDDALERLLSADAVVKSPGIPHTSPEYRALTEAGVTITSLMDLWLTENRDRVIGVTGTKGKSTTSSLIHHVLNEAGVRSQLAGNIGIPVSHPIDPTTQVAVTEISSYQAAELTTTPSVAVITSLYPEHLPWHGDYDSYVRDKLRLISVGETQVVITENDEALRASVRANVHPLSTVMTPSRLGITVTDTSIDWQGVGSVLREDLSLRGTHNLANAAVALAAATRYAPDADRRTLLAALRTFAPLSHRLETVPSGDGRTWVDDGLATAPEAVIAALTAFADRDVTLIAGGAERWLDYDVLVRHITQQDVAVQNTQASASLRIVSTGPAGTRLASLLRDENVDVTDAGSFAEALRWADTHTPQGGVVLLSPAAPSFDEFADYEARSAAFREGAAAAVLTKDASNATTDTDSANHNAVSASDERT